MLASFGVLDTRNRIVWMIGDFLYRVTEPALRPIRNFMPNFGNIDLSPLILLLLLQAARMLLGHIEGAIITGSMQYLFDVLILARPPRRRQRHREGPAEIPPARHPGTSGFRARPLLANRRQRTA